MTRNRGTLVGLKNLKQAAALTELACRVTEPGEELELVHVIEVPDATPLDAPLPKADREAADILRTGAEVARRRRRKVSTQVLHDQQREEAPQPGETRKQYAAVTTIHTQPARVRHAQD